MNERIELDRLADYAAGLLDGTREGAEVAQLIAGDPEWAAAYGELTEADERVRVDLAHLGGTPTPMPVDVVARLDAALTGAGLEGAAGGGKAMGTAAATGAKERAGAGTVVSLDAARRRRRTAILGIAAAVVAFAIFGLPALFNGAGFVGPAFDSADNGERAVTQDGGQAAAPAPPAAILASGVTTLVSGRNYQRSTLGGRDLGDVAGSASSGDPADITGKSAGVTPEALRRLTDPSAAQACLDALIAMFGGRASIVDYAHFESAPALVVTLIDDRGKPVRTVAAGPLCGLSGNGANVLYAAPVG